MNTLTEIKPLYGHNNFETAYLIEDYPYGRSLRCKKKVWIEIAEKGQHKGCYREVYCTTNPRYTGEVWNKPKCSTYSDLLIMYIDPESGYLKTDAWSSWGERRKAFNDKWVNLLNDRDRQRWEYLEKRQNAINKFYQDKTFKIVKSEPVDIFDL
jgi:hypothetical protein